MNKQWCNLVVLEGTLDHATFSILYDSLQEPTTYYEAVSYTRLVQAMDLEISTLHANNPWDLVDLPARKWAIGWKWVYKIKLSQMDQWKSLKLGLLPKDT